MEKYDVLALGELLIDFTEHGVSGQGNPVLEKMLSNMTIVALLKQAGDAIPPETVRQLNAALQQIKKSE